MMNASTTSTKLHWSQASCRRIRSSIVMRPPSETLMLRHELPRWQASYPRPCGIFAMDRSTYVQLSQGGPSRARADVAVQVLDATFEPSHQPVEFTPIVLSSRGCRQKAR